jgi:hypothetical protein
MLVNGTLVLAGVVSSLAYSISPPERGGRLHPQICRSGNPATVGVCSGNHAGVLFAGVYSAALTALIERLHFLGSVSV